MLPAQVLQNVLEGLRRLTNKEICVTERSGRIAATAAGTTGATGGIFSATGFDLTAAAADFMDCAAETQMQNGCHFFKVGDSDYAVILLGDDDETYKLGRLAAFQIRTLLDAYKERFDRDVFFKNLLMDNLQMSDIYSHANKLQIEKDTRRVVYLIHTKPDSDMTAFEIVRNLFPAKQRDFVMPLDEGNIVLLRELHENVTRAEIEKSAYIITDALAAEALNLGCVAIGRPVCDLKAVSSSYKEAQMALAVRQIFDESKAVINYETLGLGRLIYQLPVSMCHMFLDEVLKGSTVESFDDETLATVNKFFENHLNVSETSRQLFIHRNTLVYRLDKLQKATGLDLRNFEDAIIFKVTLMVSKYLRCKNGREGI